MSVQSRLKQFAEEIGVEPPEPEGEGQTHYRVWLRSVPGFYEQYDGHVDVWAVDTEDAKDEALKKLRRGAFPERSAAMWKVVKVEAL